MVLRKAGTLRAQSSLELLITLSFGLIVLLPIITLAFLQLSNSSAALSAAQSQNAANKLAGIAAAIGSEGSPSKQLVLIDVPPNVQSIFIGQLNNNIGHEITFVVSTSAGTSYVTAYTPVNVSGYLEGDSLPGSYLVNVSAQSSCPTNAALPCVYITST
jgi:hypothetical protein